MMQLVAPALKASRARHVSIWALHISGLELLEIIDNPVLESLWIDLAFGGLSRSVTASKEALEEAMNQASKLGCVTICSEQFWRKDVATLTAAGFKVRNTEYMKRMPLHNGNLKCATWTRQMPCKPRLNVQMIRQRCISLSNALTENWPALVSQTDSLGQTDSLDSKDSSRSSYFNWLADTLCSETESCAIFFDHWDF